MAMVKVIELIAQSNKSWEDAAQAAVSEAAETIRGIQSIYINDFQAVVDNGKITKYRVNAKISFLIDGKGVAGNEMQKQEREPAKGAKSSRSTAATTGGNKTM